MQQIHLAADELIRFNELMERSYKKVYNLAYRLSGNRADAEDLTQEAFYRAYRGFPGYEGDKPFENWIFRIVTRLFLDLNRSRRRRVKTVSFDAPLRPDGTDDTVMFESSDDGPTPEDYFLADKVSEELEMSLSHLSDDQRELIWMADVMGLPYKDIADKFQAPVGTIRSRLHRAHKQLRKVLVQIKAEQQRTGGKNGNALCPG